MGAALRTRVLRTLTRQRLRPVVPAEQARVPVMLCHPQRILCSVSECGAEVGNDRRARCGRE
jgi:hypothetical protein